MPAAAPTTTTWTNSSSKPKPEEDYEKELDAVMRLAEAISAHESLLRPLYAQMENMPNDLRVLFELHKLAMDTGHRARPQ